ncbi:hypothetical protein LCGC14_3057900 [marine sediment metagenome]|uniref:Uncharacterized protein n=1 Tax=marine sediment metagenome TaxID=412755 RepID=A0A0F8YSK0_9ZZZZ
MNKVVLIVSLVVMGFYSSFVFSADEESSLPEPQGEKIIRHKTISFSLSNCEKGVAEGDRVVLKVLGGKTCRAFFQ